MMGDSVKFSPEQREGIERAEELALQRYIETVALLDETPGNYPQKRAELMEHATRYWCVKTEMAYLLTTGDLRPAEVD